MGAIMRSENVKMRPSHNKYQQVPTDEDDVLESILFRPESTGQKLSRYLHSAFWVAAAIFSVVYSDMIRVIQIDPRLQHAWLYLGAVLVAFNAVMMIYLVIISPRLYGTVVEDYDKTHFRHL